VTAAFGIFGLDKQVAAVAGSTKKQMAGHYLLLSFPFIFLVSPFPTFRAKVENRKAKETRRQESW
jgi:hypothetical protein